MSQVPQNIGAVVQGFGVGSVQFHSLFTLFPRLVQTAHLAQGVAPVAQSMAFPESYFVASCQASIASSYL